ncbi:phosphate regulon sensor histidine kinase PhoR [Vulcaniibacterium thermophilum]|uniref:Phosphate regulon sensor protein PhoR n=1 Tax=Vulcaniibacterium thermophilum TaxID=1169913 RepID=A0A918Z3V5_9GAMM|nr:phosphate regulon sensor histidine kinase PhoR [Vulcaniibacterium thermophilum]GHE35638.1 phosphate regulon sensor histidine kinase PhoR [Vulcaniibacterium thermophilum]
MTPSARSAWFRTLGQLGLILLGAAVAGLLVGRPWPVVTLAALGVVAWHYLRLRRVLVRLTARQRLPPPAGEGVWNELDRLLHRSQSEMRARKRRLIEMLRAYRAAAEALPDAVVVVQRDSQRIEWFNHAATQLLRLRYPQDLGAPLADRLAPLPLAHWLATGRHAEPLEVASPWTPGATLSFRLIPYSENLWLLVARDVSRLLQLEQMRRDFVANVSHELRTPLTVVHGYLEMLDPDEHPEWAPMLTEMQKQSQRMAQLVEDLLTLSRLESQEGLAYEEPVAMAPLLATLRREAEALSQGRHEIVVEDSAGVDLYGSAKELHSAFSNLVGNAIRYTPAGGRVAVRFRPERGGAQGVVLEVADTGYGIPAAHLPRITERFYRVSNSRSRESGGTGLGLSIVKHVLHLHQARLEIASEVGQGSTFSCHFGAERVRPRLLEVS